VAEDDDALRRLLELRFSVDKYDVRSVPDGAEALALLQEWHPDVFVCDVMMPRVSGLTVIREIRQTEEYASLPVILLTARVFDEDIEAVLQLGKVTFMGKPFDFEELMATIRDAVASPTENIKGTAQWLLPADPAKPEPTKTA
jgi:two-component system response regulator MprA